MSSNYSIPPYSPYSPRDPQSNASQSPWSASSNTGSGYESLTLPPINPDINFDFNDAEQYFDSLPRLQSPDPYLTEPSNSRSQEQRTPPSNQQQSSRRRSEYDVEESESPDPFEDFIEQDFEYQSPRREGARSQNTTRASSIVDLTETSPPPDTMAPTPRKRKADIPAEGRSVRQRVHTPVKSSQSTPSRKQKIEQADVVDLVGIEDEEQYADFKAKQQAEAIKQQQQDEAKKPVKLAEFQCIICMDNPTDLTVTHCGMFILWFYGGGKCADGGNRSSILLRMPAPSSLRW